PCDFVEAIRSGGAHLPVFPAAVDLPDRARELAGREGRVDQVERALVGPERAGERGARAPQIRAASRSHRHDAQEPRGRAFIQEKRGIRAGMNPNRVSARDPQAESREPSEALLGIMIAGESEEPGAHRGERGAVELLEETVLISLERRQKIAARFRPEDTHRLPAEPDVGRKYERLASRRERPPQGLELPGNPLRGSEPDEKHR